MRVVSTAAYLGNVEYIYDQIGSLSGRCLLSVFATFPLLTNRNSESITQTLIILITADSIVNSVDRYKVNFWIQFHEGVVGCVISCALWLYYNIILRQNMYVHDISKIAFLRVN